MKCKPIIKTLALAAAAACAFGVSACNNDGKTEHVHQYGIWTVEKEATCTEAGEKIQRCSCGEYNTERIEPRGHDLENFAAKQFNCTEDGWNAYQECKRDGCGYTTKEVIKAHHVYENKYCEGCGRPQSEYEQSEDGNSYVFTGVGDAKETVFTVPSEIGGKPVTAIGQRAFHDTLVEEVIIPDSVTVIDDEAFEECATLKKVNIPDSVTHIGGGAFAGCEGLEFNKKAGDEGCYLGSEEHPYRVLVKTEDTAITSYEVSAETDIVCYAAFSGCEELVSVTIPDTVKEVGGDTFSGCVKLEEVTLPAGLKEVTPFMFQSCESLETVEIPENVTAIGDGAFNNCSSLTHINIPVGVKTIGYSAFEGSSITSVEIPSGTVSIGEYAFNYCENLETLTFSDGGSLTTIGIMAFGNSGIKSLNLPQSVTEIGSDAFSNCPNLEYAILPEGLKEICERTFVSCSSLEWVYIPAGITSVEAQAFFGSNKLAHVYYGGDKEGWKNVSVGNYNFEGEKVYYYSENYPVESGNFWYWSLINGFPEVWN